MPMDGNGDFSSEKRVYIADKGKQIGKKEEK
jgi:hypothetical protein